MVICSLSIAPFGRRIQTGVLRCNKNYVLRNSHLNQSSIHACNYILHRSMRWHVSSSMLAFLHT